MTKVDCEPQASDGSYDSSGGLFPDGYCLWKGHVLISMNCKPGYNCGGAPPPDFQPRFVGECVKVGCVANP